LSVPGPAPVPVVFDVNVLVLAIAAGESPFRSWPSPPPTSGNPSADCLGVVNDAAEFALWLSPHILVNTGRVLASVLKMTDDEIDEYLAVLAEIAEVSGGGITDPPQVVGDCPDWEDNRILDLALAIGAFLVVSADADLTTMSPWRGRPVIEPAQFASLVDASRRSRKRRR
jgi:predicted nucleic acid-binding protein